MKKKSFILGALLLLDTLAAFAKETQGDNHSPVPTTRSVFQEPSKQMLLDFEQYVQKSMRDWDVPGMAIGIVQGDKVIYTKGFGVKNLNSSDTIDADTIFQIGSVTKSFTAALTAMLVDEGKFHWNDKVSTYLPHFMLYDPWVTREFQVVDLMTQRSGLPSHAGDSLYLLGFDQAYIKHALRYIQPASSFRTQYSYVNVLFLYVADLIEKISGKSWDQNMKERIFIPLNMSNSSVDKQSFINAKNAASPHVKINDQIVPLNRDWPYVDWVYTAGPAGSVNSNVTDMMKWLSFQINNGKIIGQQIISENNMKFIHSPKTPITGSADGGNMFYAVGWVYRENNPLPIIWHDGEVTGMKSTVAFVPNAKVGIVILSNYATDLPELLAMRFFDQYFDKNLQDFSGDALAEINKVEQQNKSKELLPPKNPAAPLPLEKYSGNYFNQIYGNATISLENRHLVLKMGNQGMFKMNLSHWNHDIFQLYGSINSHEEKNGFIQFDVDASGNVKDFIIDVLEERFQKL